MKINITDVISNPEQPRKQFAEDQLNELAESIKHDGLQYPILVRPKGDKYEIVQGERRYRAHIIAGLTDIEVEIRELENNDAFHLSVIENIQREQMTPIEEANAFKKYVEMGYTHEQIAKKISKSRDYVTSRLRLLKLSDTLLHWVAEGKISDGHAKQILKMEALFNRMLEPSKFFNGTDDAFELMQSNFIKEFSTKEKITVNEVSEWIDLQRYLMIDAHLNSIIAFANGKKYENQQQEYENKNDKSDTDIKIINNLKQMLILNSRLTVLAVGLVLKYGLNPCGMNMEDMDFYFEYCLKHKEVDQKSWEIYKAHEEWKELFQKYTFDYELDLVIEEILKKEHNCYNLFDVSCDT